MSQSQLAALLDRKAICDVVVRYATGVDSRDWRAYRACFTNRVEMDFSSWDGGSARSLRADDWVSGVRAGLSGFDATHHISANHLVTLDGDRARCISYVQARHVLAGECYTLGGHYTNDLERDGAVWRIHRCRLTVSWFQGRRELFASAVERWASEADDS